MACIPYLQFIVQINHLPLAQLDRAPDSDSEGRGFKSPKAGSQFAGNAGERFRRMLQYAYLKRNITKEIVMTIQERLFLLQDEKYRDFTAKLIPNIDKAEIIGIRVPHLRSLAKELKNTTEAEAFIHQLPHTYYEENNLHAFLIEQIKDYNRVVSETERFLPYINNWATCDSFRPKVFSKHTDDLLKSIDKWIVSDKTYTVRFAIEALMSFYLDASFRPEYAEKVAGVKSDEYYINMMIAWYFATALAKQWESVIRFVEEKALSPWVHNKTIQKAIESYRISDEQKAYLKSLKVRDAKA